MATSIIPKPMSGYSFEKYNNSANNVVYKVGSTVFLTCTNGTFYSDSTSDPIRVGSASGPEWILSEKYRPVNTVEIIDTLGQRRINISTDGKVVCKTAALNGTNLRFSACWITDARFS